MPVPACTWVAGRAPCTSSAAWRWACRPASARCASAPRLPHSRKHSVRGSMFYMTKRPGSRCGTLVEQAKARVLALLTVQSFGAVPACRSHVGPRRCCGQLWGKSEPHLNAPAAACARPGAASAAAAGAAGGRRPCCRCPWLAERRCCTRPAGCCCLRECSTRNSAQQDIERHRRLPLHCRPVAPAEGLSN